MSTNLSSETKIFHHISHTFINIIYQEKLKNFTVYATSPPANLWMCSCIVLFCSILDNQTFKFILKLEVSYKQNHTTMLESILRSFVLKPFIFKCQIVSYVINISLFNDLLKDTLVNLMSSKKHNTKITWVIFIILKAPDSAYVFVILWKCRWKKF